MQLMALRMRMKGIQVNDTLCAGDVVTYPILEDITVITATAVDNVGN